MKTIKTLLIALAIVLTNVVSASGNPTKEKLSTKEKSSLVAKEISSLLVKPSFEVSNEMLAKITFMTNSNNEIVVLNVDTENDLLDKFIKSRLNYHVLATKLTNNRTYKLPVKVVVR